MVVRRRKKSAKVRGRTHSGGFSKRRRGKGHRPYRAGGKGKRGGHRKTFFLAQGIRPIGKQGIQVLPRKTKTPLLAINLKEIEESLPMWVKAGLAEKKADAYTINLTKLGFAKLLSEGKVTKKLHITCIKFSSKAKQKVEKAGGTVTTK